MNREQPENMGHPEQRPPLVAVGTRSSGFRSSRGNRTKSDHEGTARTRVPATTLLIRKDRPATEGGPREVGLGMMKTRQGSARPGPWPPPRQSGPEQGRNAFCSMVPRGRCWSWIAMPFCGDEQAPRRAPCKRPGRRIRARAGSAGQGRRKGTAEGGGEPDHPDSGTGPDGRAEKHPGRQPAPRTNQARTPMPGPVRRCPGQLMIGLGRPPRVQLRTGR